MEQYARSWKKKKNIIHRTEGESRWNIQTGGKSSLKCFSDHFIKGSQNQCSLAFGPGDMGKLCCGFICVKTLLDKVFFVLAMPSWPKTWLWLCYQTELTALFYKARLVLEFPDSYHEDYNANIAHLPMADKGRENVFIKLFYCVWETGFICLFCLRKDLACRWKSLPYKFPLWPAYKLVLGYTPGRCEFESLQMQKYSLLYMTVL